MIASADATGPAHADRIVAARYVIPVEPAGQLLEHHAVVIRDGRIHALLPSEKRPRHLPHPFRSSTHAVIPGLVNCTRTPP
jgi:5-methylthioadenosine/S-adenosylhomocysteine deaminase